MYIKEVILASNLFIGLYIKIWRKKKNLFSAKKVMNAENQYFQ